MYHSWGQEPLWPLPVAPALPVSDTAYRVIAELSGVWEGGTVPGLYAKPNWQLSREIPIPDSAWLYLPYLVGEVTIYVGERLWSVGEEKAWIPLLGPGVVRTHAQRPQPRRYPGRGLPHSPKRSRSLAAKPLAKQRPAPPTKRHKINSPTRRNSASILAQIHSPFCLAEVALGSGNALVGCRDLWELSHPRSPLARSLGNYTPTPPGKCTGV
jgi:hypothetical protein